MDLMTSKGKNTTQNLLSRVAISAPLPNTTKQSSALSKTATKNNTLPSTPSTPLTDTNSANSESNILTSLSSSATVSINSTSSSSSSSTPSRNYNNAGLHSSTTGRQGSKFPPPQTSVPLAMNCNAFKLTSGVTAVVATSESYPASSATASTVAEQDKQPKSKSMSPFKIGGIIGGILGLIILASLFAIWYYLRRRRQRDQLHHSFSLKPSFFKTSGLRSLLTFRNPFSKMAIKNPPIHRAASAMAITVAISQHTTSSSPTTSDGVFGIYLDSNFNQDSVIDEGSAMYSDHVAENTNGGSFSFLTEQEGRRRNGNASTLSLVDGANGDSSSLLYGGTQESSAMISYGTAI